MKRAKPAYEAASSCIVAVVGNDQPQDTDMNYLDADVDHPNFRHRDDGVYPQKILIQSKFAWPNKNRILLLSLPSLDIHGSLRHRCRLRSTCIRLVVDPVEACWVGKEAELEVVDF